VFQTTQDDPDGSSQPCGWKGKRKNGRAVYGPDAMVSVAEMEPCPWCRGRVELIPTGGG
jgi:hypothetical protein